MSEDTCTKCQRDALLAAAKRAESLLTMFVEDMYGDGLYVAGWHHNSDLEPFDTFVEDNTDGGELQALRDAIAAAEPSTTETET